MCKWIARSFLTLANFVDLVSGATLLGGSYYYSSHVDSDVKWFFDVLAGIGGCLAVVALMSWWGTSAPRRSAFLMVSSWLALPLCLLCLVMAVVTLAKWGDVKDKLEEDQDELDLSDDFISGADTWHSFAAYALFGMAGVEGLRFQFSKALRSQTVAELTARAQREAEELENDDLERSLLEQDVKKKYDDKRQMFREKYGDAYDRNVAKGRGEPYEDL